jgi:hypothetical protein
MLWQMGKFEVTFEEWAACTPLAVDAVGMRRVTPAGVASEDL